MGGLGAGPPPQEGWRPGSGWGGQGQEAGTRVAAGAPLCKARITAGRFRGFNWLYLQFYNQAVPHSLKSSACSCGLKKEAGFIDGGGLRNRARTKPYCGFKVTFLKGDQGGGAEENN